MDKTTLISMAVFIFTNIGTIISMFLWVRSEANLDRRESLDSVRLRVIPLRFFLWSWPFNLRRNRQLFLLAGQIYFFVLVSISTFPHNLAYLF